MKNKSKMKRNGEDKARKKVDQVYQRHLRSVSQTKFSILVWGPSPTAANPIAKKRAEIRDELNKLGHNAMFSEDISTPDSGNGNNYAEKTKELAQAKAADLIIILVENSPGALAETHDFCNERDIASKAYVLVPKTYERGYSAKGALKLLDEGHGGVYWYEDSEIKSCHVLTKAVRRVEARRELSFINKRRKGGS